MIEFAATTTFFVNVVVMVVMVVTLVALVALAFAMAIAGICYCDDEKKCNWDQ